MSRHDTKLFIAGSWSDAADGRSLPVRNPATGEEITIAKKPASVDLRARPLAKAKAALPSVQKARRRLAA